ncbi:hypothetical protein AB0J42_29015 [Nonomuraea sp. NPDC049649]|uniref:hypothetical protein n=1 Tax=Nonomuraea sp. NPDC049649 TaxID=3155776 RepID=UPI003430143F
MGLTPQSHSWQWGKARTELQVIAVTAAAPLLILGVGTAFLLGFSWRGFLWDLGLGALTSGVPPLLVFLPGRLSSSLTDPALARPATSVLLLRAGVLIEFARFGVVTLQDVQLRDAVWLGLGIQFLNVLASLTFYAVKVSLRPSPLDPEQAAAGRADPRSYGQRVFRFGRNTLVEVGLSRLLALSPWLAFVTVPVGACQARRT